ncbi:hypothetical protein BW731_03440 [Vagococcus martis]|uniref:CAAX prenyl protease 2/Lysostaphin resistance protein A-like domain-containing protein n=1 Tax=Vagococcus martis TaxID=1768210 RepID=A0A1V4DFJ6_9ENTE|nr:type II CAAX endopeptidase family protein [Vagococcus martis]OPF87329.1 hypothetical protein BW731_03440 [Vagococcus martis]
MTLNQNMVYTSFLYLFLLNGHLFLSLNDNQTMLLYSVIVFFILVIYFKTTKKDTLTTSTFSIKKIVGWGVVGLLLSFMIQWGVLFITHIIFPRLNLNTDIPSQRTYLFLFVSILFNPIMEELFFRFSFVNWIGQKLPIWVGMVISALFFMLMHTSGNLMIYFGLGIIFSYIYKKSGSILTSILVHMVMNGIVLWLN